MDCQLLKSLKFHPRFFINQTHKIQSETLTAAAPQAFENFCKFVQIRARFRFFLGKFGQSLGHFWSFVLDFLGNYSIFFGQERSAPCTQVARYTYAYSSLLPKSIT